MSAPGPNIEAAAVTELRAIYDSLPHIDCQQRCHGTCGPIVMSALEWDRITSEHGARTCEGDLVCPYLERASGLCVAYDSRPLICRLGGLTGRCAASSGASPTACSPISRCRR